LDLYKKKRVYRKEAPAMWCPECKTGVAQIEVQDKEMDSIFNNIIFKVDGKDIVVATTRPELLPACVALFYNPGDKRYEKYKGKLATVPLFNMKVPILEDKRADPNKGTGIAMCCTFGDMVDMEWQKAHNLPIKMAISEDGKMAAISGAYEGMGVSDARKKIIEDLRDADLLKSQKNIKHFVHVHERCSTPLEILKSKQWFVKYLDLKKEMLAWGREFKWHPDYMKHRYDNWVNGLQWDWLISNQRYFGVAFPVWYCAGCSEVILADEKQLPVDPLRDHPPVQKCPSCGLKQFVPEKDILNTWFTSSLTPQIALWILKDKKTHGKMFPMDLRPQGHDIITFWLFTTIVKSHLHFKKTPWKNAFISGFVTLRGEKMSKSKGNVIAPQEVLEKYGADALRYWAASSQIGEDFEYQEKDVVMGKKFVTKILNVAKFLFSSFDASCLPDKIHELCKIDKLLLLQLNYAVRKATEYFEDYHYSKAKMLSDDFFWRTFCDNYLELVKYRFYQGSDKEKSSAYFTMYYSFLTILKLFAPFTPFVTEEIYQKHFKKIEKGKSVHLLSWPKEINIKRDKNDDLIWERLLEIIASVRQAKSEAKKSLKSEIILTLPKKDKELLKDVLNDLRNVCNAREIKEGAFKVEFL
jgi:valyl-tRNA synthetase